MYIETLPGNIIDIDAGNKGLVVSIDKSYQPFLWENTSKKWIPYPNIPGKALTITIDYQSNPWVINHKNQIFTFTQGTWYNVSGKAQDISASSTDDSVFCINERNRLAKWEGMERGWEEISFGSFDLRKVSTLSKSEVIVIDIQGNVFHKKGSIWTKLFGSAIDISGKIFSAKHIACIGRSKRLFDRKHDWTLVAELNKKAAQITIDSDFHYWIVDEAGALFKIIDQPQQFDHFVPSQHGLRIPNDFDPKVITAHLERQQNEVYPSRYPFIMCKEQGLSGGINSTALDYFYAQKQLSALPLDFIPSGRIREYLLERQLDIFKSLPVSSSILMSYSKLSRIAREILNTITLQEVVSRLEQNQPVILTIFYSSDTTSSLVSQQVLAYDWEEPSEQNLPIRVKIYDANALYPLDHLLAHQARNDIEIRCITYQRKLTEALIHEIQSKAELVEYMEKVQKNAIEALFLSAEIDLYSHFQFIRPNPSLPAASINTILLSPYHPEEPPI